jgi:hypothetical protein
LPLLNAVSASEVFSSELQRPLKDAKWQVVNCVFHEDSGVKNKNAARVMPKFGLTVEKRPGAAIKGGNTRIHLLADSELTQVKQNTTSTAREFRGKRGKPDSRVNQSDEKA